MLALAGLFVAATSLGQTGSTDSPTLQALLTEVRQLRKELQTTIAAGQEAQILLDRLRMQEAAVARASQHVDDSRLKLTQAQSLRQRLAADIQRDDDFVTDSRTPSEDRKQVEDVLARLKEKLDSLEADDQQRQTDELEAEDQLRTERGKLNELQAQLDRLQKTLEDLGTASHDVQ
jgi:chromosome segregation ATPase